LDEHQHALDVVGVEFPDTVRRGETVRIGRVEADVEGRIQVLSVGVVGKRGVKTEGALVGAHLQDNFRWMNRCRRRLKEAWKK